MLPRGKRYTLGHIAGHSPSEVARRTCTTPSASYTTTAQGYAKVELLGRVTHDSLFFFTVFRRRYLTREAEGGIISDRSVLTYGGSDGSMVLRKIGRDTLSNGTHYIVQAAFVRYQHALNATGTSGCSRRHAVLLRLPEHSLLIVPLAKCLIRE